MKTPYDEKTSTPLHMRLSYWFWKIKIDYLHLSVVPTPEETDAIAHLVLVDKVKEIHKALLERVILQIATNDWNATPVLTIARIKKQGCTFDNDSHVYEENYTGPPGLVELEVVRKLRAKGWKMRIDEENSKLVITILNRFLDSDEKDNG